MISEYKLLCTAVAAWIRSRVAWPVHALGDTDRAVSPCILVEPGGTLQEIVPGHTVWTGDVAIRVLSPAPPADADPSDEPPSTRAAHATAARAVYDALMLEDDMIPFLQSMGLCISWVRVHTPEFDADDLLRRDIVSAEFVFCGA